MQNKKKLYAVSNSHLDTQWNWTIQDTIRDCVKNTLADNFALFEKYPHYHMNFEGAFRYALAKEYYPDLYEKLKEYVAEGKWSVSGSQWDASDTNVPSSEAYMRQILLGNGFFEQEFGKKSADIFLPDCFGFRWSLPSIAAHMGLVGFSTQKLQWGVGTPIMNEDGSVTKPMPDKDAVRMDLGRWVGPDGNSVIGSLVGNDYTLKFEKDPEQRPIHDRKEYVDKIDHNAKYAGVAAHMMYFGTGDYGGAATDESARYLNDAIEQNGPDKDFEVIAGSTEQIFTDLTPEQIAALPVYTGNLHIPHGFGTLTSHAISKRWNRKCELLADAAERAASVAKWLGTGRYPKERLDFAWKLFLWHQFHDDLPGTSVLDAYRFSYNDYVIAQNVLADELTASVGAVASVMDTGVSGQPVVVYNPVAVARTDLATAPIPAGAEYVRVYTSDGREIPSQIEVIDGERVAKFVATVTKEVVRDGLVYDMDSITIIEIMGRDAGWLTGASALAAGEDSEGPAMVLLPEVPVDYEYIKKRVKELTKEKKALVITVSEGIRMPDGRYVCELGAEKKIGDGKVDFKALITTLNNIGFDGNIIIEREISGEEQIKDILFAKQYFEDIFANL